MAKLCERSARRDREDSFGNGFLARGLQNGLEQLGQSGWVARLGGKRCLLLLTARCVRDSAAHASVGEQTDGITAVVNTLEDRLVRRSFRGRGEGYGELICGAEVDRCEVPTVGANHCNARNEK